MKCNKKVGLGSRRSSRVGPDAGDLALAYPRFKDAVAREVQNFCVFAPRVLGVGKDQQAARSICHRHFDSAGSMWNVAVFRRVASGRPSPPPLPKLPCRSRSRSHPGYSGPIFNPYTLSFFTTQYATPYCLSTYRFLQKYFLV